MFKIIEPESHKFNRPRIGSLLGLLRASQNFTLFPEDMDRATFIIAEDEKRGVYGGAVIYPSDIASEENTYGLFEEFFSIFEPHMKKFWMARLCFCLGNDESLSVLQEVKLCQRFYHNIHKAFAYFGEKEEIDYLTFILRIKDTHVAANTLRVLTFETWPDLLVSASDYSEVLSHGILSFKRDVFGSRRKSKRAHNPVAFITNFPSENFVSPKGRDL